MGMRQTTPLWWSGLLLGIVTQPGFAAQTSADRPNASSPAAGVAVQPTPDWVVDRALPTATKARLDAAQGGVAYLLADAQYRTRPDGHDDWFRTATTITNRSGLEEGGKIELSYDPAFETVEVNFIHLLRGGKVIDLTRDARFQVVEREAELKDGIMGGTLKAIANLSDVRVGDVIDYATTTHTATRLWPGQAFYQFSQRYSDPLAARTLRLVWPVGMVPQAKALNSDIAFTRNEQGGTTVWEWSTKDPPAQRGEGDVPSGAFQWGRVDVSTMARWGELARWAVALYRGDEALGKDGEAHLDAIAKASASPADRLTAAVRYVQDNIRYVGEELGEGSYVPRRPAVVVARGYGDCKDKSLLLAVMLRRLGIEAVPALVSTRAGERLPDRLPSPLAFDHVIVRAVLDGRVMWIDATGSHRGGRGVAIVPSALGYALPVRDEQTALEPITGLGGHAGRYAVVEKFAVDEAAAQPLTLHVETRYTDARADGMRASWAASSPAKIAADNLDFYHNRFAGLVASKPLELRDDRDANVVTMVEDYAMPRAAFVAAKLPTSLITRAYAVQNVLPDRQPSPRTQPLALSDHIDDEQVIELRVAGRDLGTIDDIDVHAGAVSFTRRATRLPDGLRMTYRLDTGPQAEVPAVEAAAVYEVSDKIKDEAGIEFHLDKAPKVAAAPEGIDPAAWTPVKADMEKAVTLIGKADEQSRLAGLSLLTAVSAKLPHPSPAAGLVEGLRGATLFDLRRPQAALASFRTATAQYDGNPPVFRLWIATEIDHGTPDTLAQAMVRTSKAQPAALAAIDKDWVRVALAKVQLLPTERREAVRQTICIALDDSGWQQVPRTAFGDAMIGCAMAAHAQRGELAQARADLAKSPPTDTLLTLAIDRRDQALWAEIGRVAGNDFRKSLALDDERAAAGIRAAPDNYAAVMRRMQTLRALGQYEQAITVGKTLATASAQYEVEGSDAFWLVNEYAAGLRAAGRLRDAVAAMDGVLALGLDRYPELGSLAINRAEMLIAAGRDQEAFDALADLEAHHAEELNPYGQMWLWANRACALRGLGRADEAASYDAKVAAKPATNWSAATAAAACRGDAAGIADMLIARLRGSDDRPAALGLFIDFEGHEARTPVEIAMRETVAKARRLPAVQAEFAKHGRSVRYAGTAQGWSEF